MSSRALTIHVPRQTTKLLRLQDNRSSGERWLRLSSNLLPLYGFEANTRFTPRVVGSGMQGLELVADQERIRFPGPCKVHLREYHHRSNNPCETQIDLKGQDRVQRAFPAWCEQVHFTLSDGLIRAVPVPNRTFHIRERTRAECPRQALVALSSGVDGLLIAKAGGFALKALIEWRPPERRDGARDLTETGAFTAVCNAQYELLYNEDIRQIDWSRVAQDLDHRPISLVAISLQCDDHSTLSRGRAQKARFEAGETVRDLVYDALRLVETAQPAAVLVETVPLFEKSFEALLLRSKLKQWGYFTHEAVLDPRPQAAGLTSRRRYYMVASVWPGFKWPQPTGPNTVPLREVFGNEIANFRDVSHCKTAQAARTSPWGRIASLDASCAGTITKSQARQAKDSVFFEEDGRILMPSEAALLKLQGIEGYDLRMVSAETGTEIIGQSVDGPLHSAIIRAIRAHLDSQLPTCAR